MLLLGLGCFAALSLTSCLSSDSDSNDNQGLSQAAISQCLLATRGYYSGKILYPAKRTNYNVVDTLDISWSVNSDTTVVINQLPPVIVVDQISDPKIKAAMAEAQPAQLKAQMAFYATDPISFLLAPYSVRYNLYYDDSNHTADLVFWYNSYSVGVFNTKSSLFEMQLIAAALYIDENDKYNYIATGGESTAAVQFILTTADLSKKDEIQAQ
jgi:hypothetical protein